VAQHCFLCRASCCCCQACLTLELTGRAHNLESIRVNDERQAKPRSGRMTCSGVHLRAAHVERNHSTLFNLRPPNLPADSRLRTTLNRRDVASCGERPKLVCIMQAHELTTLRLSSIQSRRERRHLSTLIVSGHQPNARINRAGRIQPSIRVLRMKNKLFPLRLNELLCRPYLYHSTLTRVFLRRFPTDRCQTLFRQTILNEQSRLNHYLSG
jgi:hypothetical protein